MTWWRRWLIIEIRNLKLAHGIGVSGAAGFVRGAIFTNFSALGGSASGGKFTVSNFSVP